jgi:hypothetical protein
MDEQPALVGGAAAPAAADRRHEAFDVGILLYDGRGSPLVQHHVVETGAFGGLRGPEQLALIFAGDEPFRNHYAQQHRTDQDQTAERHRQAAPVHDPGEAPFVPGE